MWGDKRPSDESLSEIIGISRSTISVWKKDGVPLIKADRIACKMGMHPAEIWGDEWWTKF